jgi:hypothetical protein
LIIWNNTAEKAIAILDYATTDTARAAAPTCRPRNPVDQIPFINGSSANSCTKSVTIAGINDSLEVISGCIIRVIEKTSEPASLAVSSTLYFLNGPAYAGAASFPWGALELEFAAVKDSSEVALRTGLWMFILGIKALNSCTSREHTIA